MGLAINKAFFFAISAMSFQSLVLSEDELGEYANRFNRDSKRVLAEIASNVQQRVYQELMNAPDPDLDPAFRLARLQGQHNWTFPTGNPHHYVIHREWINPHNMYTCRCGVTFSMNCSYGGMLDQQHAQMSKHITTMTNLTDWSLLPDYILWGVRNWYGECGFKKDYTAEKYLKMMGTMHAQRILLRRRVQELEQIVGRLQQETAARTSDGEIPISNTQLDLPSTQVDKIKRELYDYLDSLGKQYEDKEEALKMAKRDQEEAFKDAMGNLQLLETTLEANKNPVSLNVGGIHYTVARSTLAPSHEPESMLASMFSDRWTAKSHADGTVFIDADGQIFAKILFWLRRRSVPEGLSAGEKDMLKKEAEYFGMVNLLAAMK
ncbi:hypothetical protein, variant [Spizellomyces punctatus DAOM BR117]|uniref:Potassium channel tetramerisation-type BTB domain-containing protein n=1 Tax=Spizellomyces punctatus (strain DAOM BR117) TaxID=645134 RepID=A0A0L0HVZ6_SPIPD|nr:hypothetical protein, variant [Spizellomyces punctatus DAOM BR117]KND05049.1 hypothetical protein, variant [Spizellomyces punctatus DAOM BR117]|eukprot:XP_016613088.1 hypothetical protein, variant [Spizellomyces punctatus DAOM BR117]